MEDEQDEEKKREKVGSRFGKERGNSRIKYQLKGSMDRIKTLVQI